MIKVILKKTNNMITSISITGHANSGEYGNDLVCAGVSAVAIGVCNTISEKGFLSNNACLIEVDSGNIKIEVRETSQTLQVILETLEISLLSVQENYSKYIQITNKEE